MQLITWPKVFCFEMTVKFRTTPMQLKRCIIKSSLDDCLASRRTFQWRIYCLRENDYIKKVKRKIFCCNSSANSVVGQKFFLEYSLHYGECVHKRLYLLVSHPRLYDMSFVVEHDLQQTSLCH